MVIYKPHIIELIFFLAEPIPFCFEFFASSFYEKFWSQINTVFCSTRFILLIFFIEGHAYEASIYE